MIPEKFINTAEAEYFCNVIEFISIGERKELTRREASKIKMKYLTVQEWIDQLETGGQIRVMRYLREEHERSVKHGKFWDYPYF